MKQPYWHSSEGIMTLCHSLQSQHGAREPTGEQLAQVWQQKCLRLRCVPHLTPTPTPISLLEMACLKAALRKQWCHQVFVVFLGVFCVVVFFLNDFKVYLFSEGKKENV